MLAAAGSAVGLGNIWRFPYLASKDGGGIFVFVYLILAVTFGFALLTAEVAIGRKTKQGPLTAYSKLKSGWKPLGVLSCLVPLIIMPYYCVIGGWVLKYLLVFITGEGSLAAADSYFSSFLIKPCCFRCQSIIKGKKITENAVLMGFLHIFTPVFPATKSATKRQLPLQQTT